MDPALRFIYGWVPIRTVAGHDAEAGRARWAAVGLSPNPS